MFDPHTQRVLFCVRRDGTVDLDLRTPAAVALDVEDAAAATMLGPAARAMLDDMRGRST